ncbi:hypothetical protein ABZ896_43115, partial [Streptomyces sp. NPDC047072]
GRACWGRDGGALGGCTGGGGRAGAIVAGVLTAAGGYVVGSVRARRGGPTFQVVEIKGEHDG